MAFPGFSADTLAFLGDLAQHNDRAWFAENRERYERELLERQREYVSAIGAAFARVDPRVQAVPAVDRSIFRINRDTRFAHDKSPYKTYADVWFWIGEDRKTAPGYFLRMVPGEVLIGGGTHGLADAQAARYRAAVVAEDTGERLQAILDELERQGFVLGPPERKTVPRGFSATHPRADLLRHDHVHVIRRYAPPPAELLGPEFVGWSMERFLAVKPVVDWLAENAG